jgi:hypothetical protein
LAKREQFGVSLRKKKKSEILKHKREKIAKAFGRSEEFGSEDKRIMAELKS